MELYENSAFASLAGQLFAVPFGGYADAQYDGWFRTFISEFKHPKFGVGVEGLIYQPMVELIRYLESSGFAVYIFTADEAAFLRLVAEDLYGLPPERVQGTSVRSEFIIQEEKHENEMDVLSNCSVIGHPDGTQYHLCRNRQAQHSCHLR